MQAIVYVVDAADHDGLDSGRQELHELLQKPSLAHTPLLVLGNKDDLPGALSTTELIERLDLKVSKQNTCSFTNLQKLWSWGVSNACATIVLISAVADKLAELD